MKHARQRSLARNFSVYENATYEYTVEAWTDVFAGWQHEFAAKFEAGIA